jgi:soluble lytic murein transglycosylase-like protein
MGGLSLLLATALASATPPPPPPSGIARWRREIASAAARCGIPADWIARVMRAESTGRTTQGGHPIRSAKGAIGLMQLMPGTWAEMRLKLNLGADPYHTADNIVAGGCYLRMMHDRFGYPGLFAAYNAGPARYATHLRDRTPLPAETVAYLRAVDVPIGGHEAVVRQPSPPLFVVKKGKLSAPGNAARPVLADGLFAIRGRDD